MESQYNPQFQMPKDEKLRKVVEESAHAATTELQSQGIMLPAGSPELLPNITNVYLKNLVECLAADPKASNGMSFDLGGVLTLRTSIRASEKGEKGGNICIMIEPGPITKKAFKNDDATEEADEEDE